MGTDPAGKPISKDQPQRKGVLAWPSVRLLRNFIVLPLIGTLISGMIIGRVVNTFLGPKQYTVYIIGDKGDKSNEDLMSAAKGSGNFGETLGGVTVKAEVRNDFGDPGKARSIAERLQRRNDVLMVIGHGSSTSTLRAIPYYLHADPPIPVILTTETNPNLYTPPGPNQSQLLPVFRLSPTDNIQAKTAVDFLHGRHAQSVWVVVDTSNPVYSEYLATKFLNDVYEAQYPKMKVVLWSTNLNLPPYAIDKLGIDWVFFIGNWQDALLLIHQLRQMKLRKTPQVLVSDAAADNQLITYGGQDVQNVYLLNPLTVNQFKKGYTAVGKKAHSLTSELIDAVHQNFKQLAAKESPVGYRVRSLLGVHRVSDARRALADYMSTAANNQTPFNLPSGTIKMMQADNHTIICKDALFHVWQVVHSEFRTVQ